MTITEPECVSRFREYLRIKTVHPEPDYKASTEYLVNQAIDIGLKYKVLEPVPGKPIVIMKLPGVDPELKSILLSSHTDVVPVFEEFWSYPPFSAERVPTGDGDFKIFARGSQDMKVTTFMHLEALRIIIRSGKQLNRNIYLVLAPDEEIGGKDGVAAFVETKEFEQMNVGFDLDEGYLCSDDTYVFLYAERIMCQAIFTAQGNTGHGSQFIEGTAIEKLLPVINEMMDFRKHQREELEKIETSKYLMRTGEVTTVNLTELSGGKQPNVVPATYSATFDIRVTPNVGLDKFKSWLEDVAKRNGVEIKYIKPGEETTITKLDRSNPFIDTFFNNLESQNLNLIPIFSIGCTDARQIRRKGIPSFGFCPINHQPRRAHGNDEFVYESQYLKGINIFTKLIPDLANLP